MVCNGQFVYAIRRRRRTTTGQSVLGIWLCTPVSYTSKVYKAYILIHNKEIYRVHGQSNRLQQEKETDCFIFHSKPISNRLDDKKKRKKEKSPWYKDKTESDSRSWRIFNQIDRILNCFVESSDGSKIFITIVFLEGSFYFQEGEDLPFYEWESRSKA